MLKSVNIILNNFDVIGPSIAIIVFCFRSKLSSELRLMLVFCVIQMVCNLAASLVGTSIGGNNYWVYKVNTILSFATILILFSRYVLPGGKKNKILLITVFIVFSFVPMFFGDGIITYNSKSAALSSITIVAYCLYYFYTKLIHSSPEESAPSTSIFWCIIGLFTYYAGAFFIFISYKLLIEHDNGTSLGTLWRFHNILLFICCLYIIYGISWKRYQKIFFSY